MIEIRCPACGEDDDLERDPTLTATDGSIPLHCRSCGNPWERHPRVVCGWCGSDQVDVTDVDGWADAGPADAAWPYHDRAVLTCRRCRHRWTRVGQPKPYAVR